MQTKIELSWTPVESLENAMVVAFKGDLDATNVEEIVESVFKKMTEGTKHVIADFTNLRYVNSTGLGILLHFSKSARDNGGTFKVACVNDNVYEIIDIIGATSLLEIFDTIDDAVASYL